MDKKIMIIAVAIFIFVIIYLSGILIPKSAGDNMKEKLVAKGNTVSVLYTGKFENGEVFDSSEKHGNVPLTFVAGAGQMITGFDKAVIGMKEGETKTVKILPEDAYGPEGSGHPLAGKTLIFEINLVKIE